MKKGLAIGALVLFVGLTSGCGTKTLTCTGSMEEQFMKSDNKIVATFKGDKVTKLDIDMDCSIDQEYTSYIDQMVVGIDQKYDEMSKMDGVTYKSEKNANGFNIKINMDTTKLSDEELEKLDFKIKKQSIKETKKELEKAGFTCKY